MRLDSREESKLIRAHEPELRAQAERLGLGDDDGLQCARLGMLRAMRKFEPESGGLPFEIYVSRGVWMELRQELDRRRRRVASQPANAVDQPDFDDVLYLRGLLDALEADDTRAAAIVCMFLSGSSHDDVAAVSNVSRSRVAQIASAVAWRANRVEKRHAQAMRKTRRPRIPTLEERVLAAVRAQPGLLTWQYALAGEVGSRLRFVRGALEQLEIRGLVRHAGGRWRPVWGRE